MYLAEFSSWRLGDRRNNIVSDMWKMTKDSGRQNLSMAHSLHILCYLFPHPHT